MHLADGIVSQVPAVVALNGVGLGAVCVAFSRSLRRTSDIAWMGTLGAFVFAAQAVNLPIVPGTSTHLLGASLLTLVLGPSRAIITMFAVLTAQALLLADGGITVLGINTLNIAVLPALIVHACTRLFAGLTSGRAMAACVGTALGHLAGAFGLGAALVMGTEAPALWTLGWLGGIQALAGVAEGALTTVVVSQLSRRAPALVFGVVPDGAPLPLDAQISPPIVRRRMVWVAWLAVGMTLALLPFASANPDALDRLVQELGMTR